MAFQIKYVYDLVDKISPSLLKIQNNLKRTATKVNQSANSMARSFEKVRSKLDSVGKKSISVGKAMFVRATLPLTLLGASFVKVAADAEETANKFDEIFKGIGDKGTIMSARLSKDLDLANSTTQDLLSRTGDLLTGIGLTSEEALNLSGSVVSLSADLASFKNTQGGAARAALAITKALLGENEMLKDAIGTQIGAKEVAERAIKISKVRLNLTEKQAKAMATLQIIAERNKAAIGDLARTKASLTNRTRKLTEDYKRLSVTLGTILIPFALKLVNIIIRIIDKFQRLSPAMQKVILIVAGLTAILPPLLIMLGLMAAGVVAISGPVGVAVIGIIALSAAVIALWDDLNTVYNFLKDFFAPIFDFIGKKIERTISAFKSISGTMKSVFGGGGDISVNQSAINQTQAINQPQAINAGGQLDINFRNTPKGTSTNFTPAPNNFLPTFTNSVFAQ